MLDGQIVESMKADQLVESAIHPYTRSLLASAGLKRFHRDDLGLLLLVDNMLSNPTDDVDHHVIQAEHFLKRGWIADAEEEYLTAYALPDGPKSSELASVGARIAGKIGH